MSMLDGLFNKGFRGSKCKTLLKLAIPRIKLLRNRRELQIKQMRKDIAKLLETGQEATARIRVEHIIREENMMAAQEIIELFCELIAVRLPIIENQRECPLDLKEAISSVCFAAPRCADLPELLQVQLSFASKYGREFIVAATELMPDCGVNRQLIELLSVRAPSADKKLKLLKEIAEEHGLDWDPASSETELFKPHEDLLDGSRQFVSGSRAPLPEEKHEVLHTTSTKAAVEQPDSDSGLDSLDFPEVPTAILRPSAESVSAKEETPFPSAPHPEPGQRPASEYENITRQPAKEPEDEDIIWAGQHDVPGPPKDKQYVPFTYPPPMLSQPASFKEAAPPSPESPTRVITDPSPQSLPRFQNERAEPSPQPLPVKAETKLNLQDVLAAAKAAADSADRAAAAARSAASLAHLRISELSELSSNRFGQSSDVLPDNPFGMDNPNPSEKLQLDRQVSSAGSDDSANAAHTIPGHHQTEPAESLFKTTSFGEVHEQASPQQLPKRVTSAEDDLLGSYPNLFGSGGHSFTGTPHSRN